MSLTLYLDEDLPPRLARLLRDRGYDVVSAHDVGALGEPDHLHLDRATAAGRALLTCNYADFIRLARERTSAGGSHAGIVISYRQWSRRELGTLVASVAQFLDEHSPEEMANALFVLPSTASPAAG